jgi:hypothetical protein
MWAYLFYAMQLHSDQKQANLKLKVQPQKRGYLPYAFALLGAYYSSTMDSC